MKYKLLKDKIGYLEWYTLNPTHPEILDCNGFHCGPVRREYVDILPDVVEEFTPYYTVEFDQHLAEDTMHKPAPEQFYFKSPKRARQITGGVWTVVELPNHYVGIRREWVELIDDLH